jgi:hypothetical protein
MGGVYGAAAGRGREPAFRNWANIFQQKVDFWYGDGLLKLVVTVPVAKPQAVRMTLYGWRPLQMMSNVSFIHITTPQRWFAIEEETGALMTLSTDQLEKCTRVRGLHFCTAATVRYSAGQGSCLQALWAECRGHQEQMPIALLPLSPQIWSTGNGTFLTTAEGTTDVAIRCLEKSDFSMRLNKGMSIITLPMQCSVSTTTWATVQETESHDPVVTWEVQQQHVHHLMNNNTALTLEVISRPRAVAKIGQEVKNRLSLRAFSTGEIRAMILGGTALVIILGAVGVLWFKARYGSLRELFSATVEKGIGETAEKHYSLLKFSVCCDYCLFTLRHYIPASAVIS